MPVLGVLSSIIFLFLGSNWKILFPINLKLNRVTGHHQGLVAFEVGVGLISSYVLVLKTPEIFWFLDSNLKRLCSINFKLNRTI